MSGRIRKRNRRKNGKKETGIASLKTGVASNQNWRRKFGKLAKQ